MRILDETIKKKFVELFKHEPLLVRSPGRVNLIGEHTDYNDGFVLPAAIDKYITFAVQLNGSNKCRLNAYDLSESYDFEIAELHKVPAGWANYLLGVVDQLIKNGNEVQGFDCVFGGDIPIGAGLSSSAAIEAGLMYTLDHLHSFNISKEKIVRMAQLAEHEYAGVKCGIMDQFINIFGKENKVLKLDCRSLEYEYYPFDFNGISIVLCDTQIKHSLASSEYNIRRMQCEEGVKILKNFNPNIINLRDVSSSFLNNYKEHLPEVIYKRCRYVVGENERLLDACEDLINGDIESFGKKMVQTHYGLRDDYKVSCSELDFLVDLAVEEDGVFGSRMMGGGFGGCTINLVKNQYLRSFTHNIPNKYKIRERKDIKVYITSLKNGTSLLT